MRRLLGAIPVTLRRNRPPPAGWQGKLGVSVGTSPQAASCRDHFIQDRLFDLGVMAHLGQPLNLGSGRNKVGDFFCKRLNSRKIFCKRLLLEMPMNGAFPGFRFDCSAACIANIICFAHAADKYAACLRDEVFAMSDRDDLDASISFRVSTKERQRLKELADADETHETRISTVARRLFRQALRESDDGNGVAA
jgi:hypothetical protein